MCFCFFQWIPLFSMESVRHAVWTKVRHIFLRTHVPFEILHSFFGVFLRNIYFFFFASVNHVWTVDEDFVYICQTEKKHRLHKQYIIYFTVYQTVYWTRLNISWWCQCAMAFCGFLFTIVQISLIGWCYWNDQLVVTNIS